MFLMNCCRYRLYSSDDISSDDSNSRTCKSPECNKSINIKNRINNINDANCKQCSLLQIVCRDDLSHLLADV